jgi:DNA-binding MarR family transcriptional regulator
MEKQGLVLIIGCELDKRIHHVYYTEKGSAVFQKAKPVFFDVIEQLTKNLTENQINCTMNTLEQIIENSKKITKPIL